MTQLMSSLSEHRGEWSGYLVKALLTSVLARSWRLRILGCPSRVIYRDASISVIHRDASIPESSIESHLSRVIYRESSIENRPSSFPPGSYWRSPAKLIGASGGSKGMTDQRHEASLFRCWSEGRAPKYETTTPQITSARPGASIVIYTGSILTSHPTLTVIGSQLSPLQSADTGTPIMSTVGC